jgi:hypothetical protein
MQKNKNTLTKHIMKKLNLLLFAVIAVILSSCAVTQTSTTKTMDIYGAGVIQRAVVAELDVSETRVEAEMTGSKSSTTLKDEVLAKAIYDSKADILVEPRYYTKSSGAYDVTIKVTGYPATYKNFRPIEEGDLDLIKAGYLVIPKTKTATSNDKK